MRNHHKGAQVVASPSDVRNGYAFPYPSILIPRRGCASPMGHPRTQKIVLVIREAQVACRRSQHIEPGQLDHVY
jgi:hypothetical protein